LEHNVPKYKLFNWPAATARLIEINERGRAMQSGAVSHSVAAIGGSDDAGPARARLRFVVSLADQGIDLRFVELEGESHSSVFARVVALSLTDVYRAAAAPRSLS
jgi:hypothetical protein